MKEASHCAPMRRHRAEFLAGRPGHAEALFPPRGKPLPRGRDYHPDAATTASRQRVIEGCQNASAPLLAPYRAILFRITGALAAQPPCEAWLARDAARVVWAPTPRIAMSLPPCTSPLGCDNMASIGCR